MVVALYTNTQTQSREECAIICDGVYERDKTEGVSVFLASSFSGHLRLSVAWSQTDCDPGH